MRLKRFNEYFNTDTINFNNTEYKKYLNRSGGNRSSMVAWEVPQSQIKNFDMVSKFINNNDSLLDYGCGVGDFVKYLEEDKNINLSKYKGVDINDEFIKIAEETYPNKDFQVIKGVDDIEGKFDIVCAIGVFTWYITREDFINTINHLHSICNKRLILTCLYANKYTEVEDNDKYWSSKYRKYKINLFKKLFPNLKFKFKVNPEEDTLLVIIEK